MSETRKPRNPSRPPRGRPRSRRRGRSRARSAWAIGAAVFVLGAAAAFLFREPSAPPLVAMNLDGVDPAIGDAIRQAQEAAQAKPRSAEARGRLGMALLAHEARAEARQCFEQAQVLAPSEPRWPYFLGLSELPDDPAAAAESFERALHLFPPSESAPRLRLANTLLALNRLDEAEALFRQVRSTDPNSGPAALGLGRVSLARENFAEAVERLTAAAASPFTRKAACRLLLNANRALGRTDRVKDLAASLAGLPNDLPWIDPFAAEIDQLEVGEDARIEQADEWIKAGRSAEAAQLLERTLSSHPQSHRVMFFLGRARWRLGDAEGAEMILERATRLAPDSVEAQMQLGVVRLGRGRLDEAQACFRAAIDAKPNLGEAWFNLGLSLGREPDRQECLAAFREAIRLKPNLGEARLALAVALRAEGEDDAAAKELRRALDLDPAEPLKSKLLSQLKLIEGHDSP